MIWACLPALLCGAGVLFILSNNSLAVSDSIKFPYSSYNQSVNSVIWSSQKASKKLEFHLFEDFESNLQWVNPKPAAVKHKHRFVYINPLNDKKTNEEQKKEYQNDLNKLIKSAQIHWRKEPLEQKLSYELRCFFIRPGKDKVFIQPHAGTLNKFTIYGLPRMFSVWIKSTRKRHKLYAFFSNHVRKKIPVYMGNLDFEGWLRLEKMIPNYLIKRNPKKQNKYELTFEGFKIQSSKGEEAGIFIIAFDLIMLTINRDQDNYPGAKMKDKF